MNLQLFATEYCPANTASAKAMAGKNLLLAIWNSDGSKLLAVSGQQGLTINRSADTIEITTKDIGGGWKEKIAGVKDWSIDNNGLFIMDDESHKLLGKAFNDDELVCLKVIDIKKEKSLFGGLAIITDYPIEAPYDDAVTYSLTFDGTGPLVDFTVEANKDDKVMPGAEAAAAVNEDPVTGEE